MHRSRIGQDGIHVLIAVPDQKLDLPCKCHILLARGVKEAEGRRGKEREGEGRRGKGETRRRWRGRRMKIRIVLCIGTARASALSPTCIFKMGKLWQPATPALLPLSPIAAPRPAGTSTASSVICSRMCVQMTHCWGACCPGCSYDKFLIIPPLYFRYTLACVSPPSEHMHARRQGYAPKADEQSISNAKASLAVRSGESGCSRTSIGW